MTDIEKIKYLLQIQAEDSLQYGITAIVPSSEVKGERQCNDSSFDYFDHYFVDQGCWEDSCSGDVYYPLDGEGKEYVKIYYCA